MSGAAARRVDARLATRAMLGQKRRPMNDPWRHHSVPQFLLQQFADVGGLLFHFDKRRPDKGIGYDGPKGIFYERDLYSSFDDRTGKLDPRFEKFLDRRVENPAAPIIAKIIKAARVEVEPRLTKQARRKLDLFLQYQMRRAPEFTKIHTAEFQGGLRATLASMERDYGPLPQYLKDEISDPNSRLSKDAVVYAQARANPSISAFQSTQGLLIAVIADAKKAFAIGSNPIVFASRPLFREFGVHGLWLPIASDVAISLGGPAGAEIVRPITEHSSVRRLNELTFQQSDKVAGRSRRLIESLSNRRR